MNARFYVPSLNRFASADTIVPSPENPQSLNRYSYVQNNPILLKDITGHCADYYYDDVNCWQAYAQATNILGEGFEYLQGWTLDAIQQLLSWLNRGIRFEGSWSEDMLRNGIAGLELMLDAFEDVGGWDVMARVLGLNKVGTLTYVVEYFSDGRNHQTFNPINRIVFNGYHEIDTFLHETGHVVDYWLEQYLNNSEELNYWSQTAFIGMGWRLGTHMNDRSHIFIRAQNIEEYRSYGTDTPKEDFSDAFTAWVLGENRLPNADWQKIHNDRAVALTTAFHEVQWGLNDFGH